MKQQTPEQLPREIRPARQDLLWGKSIWEGGSGTGNSERPNNYSEKSGLQGRIYSGVKVFERAEAELETANARTITQRNPACRAGRICSAVKVFERAEAELE